MMKIADAALDAQGRLYGPGRLAFPPDPEGRFASVDTGTLRLWRDAADSDVLGLASAQASRDPVTGYLVGQEAGPSVILPRSLGVAITSALRLGVEEPMRFAMDLSTVLQIRDGDRRVSQYVSDWHCELSADGDDTVFRLSAALRARPDQRRSVEPGLERDIWNESDGPDAPRLEIEFRLDGMTRVLCFGGHLPSAHSTPIAASEEPATTLASMRLDATTVTTFRGMFGRTPDGKWRYISDSDGFSRSMSVDAPMNPSRDDSGFGPLGEWRFPRIRFDGISLDSVAKTMWWKRHTVFRVSGDVGGYITWVPGNGNTPHVGSRLIESSSRFELTTAGLVWNYSVLPLLSSEQAGRYADSDEADRPSPDPAEVRAAGGWIRGRLTIPWEVLILRSPVFVQHQQSLLAGDERSPER